MINSTLIELKKLLNSMENDFGLNSLSEVERNVLYAIKDLEKENGAAKNQQNRVKRTLISSEWIFCVEASLLHFANKRVGCLSRFWSIVFLCIKICRPIWNEPGIAL